MNKELEVINNKYEKMATAISEINDFVKIIYLLYKHVPEECDASLLLPLVTILRHRTSSIIDVAESLNLRFFRYMQKNK